MSGIRSITRRGTQVGFATVASAPIRIDPTTNTPFYNGAGSGTTEIELVDVSTAQTLVGKTLTSPIINSVPVTVAATTLTPSPSLHAGKIVGLTSLTGCAVTLPAASGTGNIYTFVRTIAATSGSDVFAVANASDFMRGMLMVATDDADAVGVTFPTLNTGTVSTESDTVTWDRSTKGVAGIGDWISFQDIVANVWLVNGQIHTTGAEATSFSAAV